MIRIRVIVGVLGKVLIIIGLAMLTSVFCSWLYSESVVIELLKATAITIFFGFLLWFLGRNRDSISYKEGVAVVALSWLAASFFGCLPYLLTGYCPSYADAFFETVSGFTTTGATIFTDVETLPRGILYWRSLTQWLGGAGIMVLLIAFMQNLGVRATQIYKNEVAGGSVVSKVNATARDTARNLWKAYLVMTVVLLLFLWAEGMTMFDALCHTFTTVATGGFSTYNASIAHFPSPIIQWTIIVFMFLAGTNFALHYLSVTKRNLKFYWRNGEWRFYLFIVLVSGAIIIYSLEQFPWGEYRIRVALFQAISILTTTGFITDDYVKWSILGQMVIFVLSFLGASAGSTSGGFKAGRLLIMFQRTGIELKKIVHPRAVVGQRFDDHPLSEGRVINVLLFLFLYVVIIVIATLALGAMDIDLVTSFSAAISCMANTGPGFGDVGPVLNYASIPYAGKYVLSVIMLFGRLEIFSLLVLFYPMFWKKS